MKGTSIHVNGANKMMYTVNHLLRSRATKGYEENLSWVNIVFLDEIGNSRSNGARFS